MWRRAIDRAIEEKVDAVLVPGDLFDGEEVDAETVNYTIECVRAEGCPPVFIAPGNHDCYSRSNTYYDNGKLAARQQPTWPEHVYIYQRPEFFAASIPELPGIELWGRCVHANVDSDERVLLESPSADPSRLQIALLHGSRDGFRKPGKRLTAPFSDSELFDTEFDYVALGHYHEPAELTDGNDVLRATYSGSTGALDRDETGEHGALLVELEIDPSARGAARRITTNVERIELDDRKLHGLEVDLTDCGSPDAALDRVRAALDQSGVKREDLVYCRLTGRPLPGVEVVPQADLLSERVWFIHFVTKELRPAYDLASYQTIDPRTTEERFARSLLSEIEAATDPEEKAKLEAALYYGLDALRQGQVAPRYDWDAL